MSYMNNSVIWFPSDKNLKIPSGIEENIVYYINAVGESSYIIDDYGAMICDLTGFMFLKTYYKKFGYTRYEKAIITEAFVDKEGRVIIPIDSIVDMVSMYIDGDVRVRYNGDIYTVPYYYLRTLYQNRNDVINDILNG